MSTNNNTIQPRLQYHYAKIDTVTGRCKGCATYSYEIIHDAYIPVPRTSSDYIGKYYNQQDGLWYTDGTFTVLADGLN